MIELGISSFISLQKKKKSFFFKFYRMVKVIADEFLTDERERKYYADRYSCCPPPLFIILITLVEVGVALSAKTVTSRKTPGLRKWHHFRHLCWMPTRRDASQLMRPSRRVSSLPPLFLDPDRPKEPLRKPNLMYGFLRLVCHALAQSYDRMNA